MRAPDLLLLGFATFLAGALIGSLLIRALGGLPVSHLPHVYRETHARVQEWLERRNILRLPGSCLVDSVRPWILGESAMAITLSAAGFLGGGFAPIGKAIPAAVAIGIVTLFLALRGEARRALLSVQRDLPVACFLLSLLLESGMGPSAALQETVTALPAGPLAREIGELVRARSLGVPREESLDRSRRRVPSGDYRLFLSHIRQGERLGIGLSGSLRELSAKLLESQRDRAETIAQQAAVKMLAPLVLFIFPAVFLIILSPVLFGLWGRIGG
ncbi:MAG TPA: type II secretion system F family protein [Candidatus Deferrimicrobiaceae bacterium]